MFGATRWRVDPAIAPASAPTTQERTILSVRSKRRLTAIARRPLRCLQVQSSYPDATFTLRLSYGAVAGWTWRGVTTAPFTTFSGLYRRATGEPPYDLDPRWIAAKDRLNPDTIFNFTTTNDIVGGNSGSPVLDAKAT